MSNTWVFIMAVMILGNFILQMLPTSVFIPGVIIVHLLILLFSYILLKSCLLYTSDAADDVIDV